MAGHFQEFEDEYLETMYEFYEQDFISGSALVTWRNDWVSSASATEMIQRLSEKVIDYQRLQGCETYQKGLNMGK